MTGRSTPTIPVAWGELIDKLTILEIKRERITAPDALRNVEHEHAALSDVLGDVGVDRTLREELLAINESLWEIEDRLREREALQAFDDEFVALARSVYRLNDRRAALKREISARMGSAIFEEKSYADY